MSRLLAQLHLDIHCDFFPPWLILYHHIQLSSVNESYNDPPDLFKRRREQREKRRKKDLSDEEFNDLMIQREAMRELRLNKSADASNKARHRNIEGKREDESMKAFKRRIREETRRTLHEEISNMTSTSKRRKQKLKEIKEKKREQKRLKKGGKGHEEEDNLEFHQSEDGKVRPSDRGGPATFRTKELSKDSSYFLDTVDRPPDLRLVNLKRKREKTSFSTQVSDGQKLKTIEIIQQDSYQLQGKSLKSSQVVESAKLEMGNQASGVEGDVVGFTGSGSRFLSASAGAKANTSEMELLRAQVQEAYKTMKAKKAKERGAWSASSYIM